MSTRIRIGRPIRAPAPNRKTSQEHWEVLANGINEIYKQNASQLSFEELYRNAYNMVIYKDGDMLYRNVKNAITDQLNNVIINDIAPAFPQLRTDSSIQDDELFLRAMKSSWSNHTTTLGMFRDVLMYMDRTFLPSKNLPLTYEMGLEVYRDVVVRSNTHPVKNNILGTLFRLVEHERNGDIVDKTLLAACIQILDSLHPGNGKIDHFDSCIASNRSITLYDTDFEQELLNSTTLYYQKEGEELIKSLDAVEYLKKVETRLSEERSRVESYLQNRTESKLLHVLDEQLLSNHVTAIIQKEKSGLVPMIENNRFESLKQMYVLFSRVSNGLPAIISHLCTYFKKLGKDVLEEVMNVTENSGTTKNGVPVTWVEKILKLKADFDILFEQCFQKDAHFETSMTSAFQTIVNDNPKSAEYISLYIDHSLRQQSKGKLEEEFDTLSDKAIAIFRFLKEKDMFERYYKQHLSKRLLYVKNISEDAEKTMIGKLKLECGYQFTAKLEGMFTDTRVSNDLMVDFKKHIKDLELTTKTPDLSLNVLTSTYWPFSTGDSTSLLPNVLSSTIMRFERFYISRYSGRKVLWLRNMGTADLKAVFPKSNKELNMSTYAMIVLLTHFNEQENEPVTFETIQQTTEIPAPDLMRTLQSLSLGKHRILTKLSKGKDINPADQFQNNLTFTSPLSKIKILTIKSNQEDSTERQGTINKVNEDRKHQIEATIVRIMKSRKSLDHNNLISEVIGQLNSRFTPIPSMVKNRIESLIEREYLERDELNRLLLLFYLIF
ncbi:Cullin-domain-containing protein [Globomyces pollinis-pini]|nr:Cullin-domain-containing protein [Globomyces pollinis-pini]